MLMVLRSAMACLAPKRRSWASVPIGMGPFGMWSTFAKALASALQTAAFGAFRDPKYMQVDCTAVVYHLMEVDQCKPMPASTLAAAVSLL